MAKKERMKNGLDMLFEDNFSDEQGGESGGIKTLRISLIEPDKNQPRTNFDSEKLQELAENISQHGVLQPILVRPIDDGYRIVAGERRWRAARIAGLSEIPVIIRELDDFETAQIALIENLQREDLDPIEEAKAFKRLMDEYGMTQEQLSKKVGKSRAGIANSVRMLKLPENIQKKVSSGVISVGHAKIICGIEDENLQIKMCDEAENGCSVKELTRKLSEEEKNKEKEPAKPKNEKNINEDFSDPFKKYAVETQMSFKQIYGIDAKVEKEKNGGFSLKLSFKNEAELKEMIAQLAEKL